MENQEEKGRAEKILGELGRSIDGLIAKSGITEEQIKKEFDEGVEELKKMKIEWEKEAQKIKEESKDKWKEAEPRLKNAALEVKKAIEIIFGNKEKNT
jgi:dsDNA-specific endonuclease/ATPase MutS2